MTNTSSITSDIVVRARVLFENDDETVLEFQTENEHSLMRGAHNVQVIASPELDALHNGAYNIIVPDNYTVLYNLVDGERHKAQALLFAKPEDGSMTTIRGVVFKLHVWNSKKRVEAPIHHEPAEEDTESFGAELGDSPSSPKKQKLDGQGQD